MSQPFIAEIRIVGFTFAPRGWVVCDGQTINIAQNTALFSLLGTTYGGNGTTTFRIPDLRSRVAIHWGQGPGLSSYVLGQTAGVETVTLTSTTTPSHNHGGTLLANVAQGTATAPAGSVPATPAASARTNKLYSTAAGDTINTTALTSVGSASPTAHNNLMSYQTVMYIIATLGVFPARN
jgi:microcystin-dependent protein